MKAIIIIIFNYLLEIQIVLSTTKEYTAFYNPIVSLSILNSYNFSTNTFYTANYIRQQLSYLIYTSRLFFIGYLGLIEDIYHENNNEELNKYNINIKKTHYVNVSKDSLLNTVFNSEYYRYFTLKSTSYNYFQYISTLRAYLAPIARATISENKPILDINQDTIEVYNIAYNIGDIKLYFKTIILELEDILYNKLLFTSKSTLYNSIGRNIDKLQDNKGKRDNNYSIEDNELFNSYTTYLSSLVVDSNTVFSKYLLKSFSIRQNKPKFYISNVSEWLNIRDRFIKLLALSFYCLSGNPVRGEELILLRYKNSLKGGLRNIIYNSNLNSFYINLYWDKSLNITEQNKDNIRFVPLSITYITLYYLVLVNPFYRSLKRDYYNIIIDTPYLFEIDNKRITSSNLSTIFKENSNKFFEGRNLTLNPYRHLINYIIKSRFNILDPFNPFKEDITNNIVDILSNHTEKTADYNYSLSKELPLNISTNFFKLSQDFCFQFFKYFEIDSYNIVINNVKDIVLEDNSNSISRGSRANSSSILKGHKHKISYIEKEASKNIKFNLNPQEILKKDNTTSDISRFNIPISSSITRTLNLHSKLKELLKSSITTFKSKEQEEAIINIINRDSFTIFISSTGSGKSLLFFLPAFIYSRNRYIVITPRLELKKDLFNKVKDFNIEAGIFEDNTTINNTTLLFISFESLLDKDFHHLIMNYKENDTNLFFILDEAHLFIIEESFRPLLKYTTSILKYKIPILFLSTTLPNLLITLLETKFNIVNFIR